MTKIMLSVADWRRVEISPFCRILQNTPGIRHHLPNFDLMTKVDQISEGSCSVVLKRECMFCFCLHIAVKSLYAAISMQQLAQAFEQSDVSSFCLSKPSMYLPAIVPEEGTS
jgi:hypothetical protein